MQRIQMMFEGAPPELETARIADAIELTARPNGETMQLSIRFVPPSEMAHLHQFKGGQGPTNVLTFARISGADIAICPQLAKEDAMIRGWDLRSELYYLCVHGCLHALGFDHRSRASANEMVNLERRILTNLGLESHPSGP